MTNPFPLLIVMGTLLALLAVQRLLARGHAPAAIEPPPPEPAPAPPRPRGRPLVAGIAVTGLDERGISRLRELVATDDITATTTFLAFNRPGFVEIDTYLAQQFSNGQRPSQDGQIRPAASSLPADLQLESLTENERNHLLRHNPKTPRVITRELMARFGGHEFNTYFTHYTAREQSVTLHIPPFDPDRGIFEALAKSGVARKGRHIPLEARLTVLKMSQLRQMAKDLNLDKKFSRKQDAAKVLADVPGAAVLLSMQYVVDDLFILNPINEDIEQVKSEWAFLRAYAKLLRGLKSKLPAPTITSK